MAARRLLIVMLILLGISSAIAVIVPEPNRDDPPPEETASNGTTGETGATGTTGETGTEPERVRRASVSLGAARPARIEAEPGTRMILTVTSKEGSVVEIDGLGLTGFADPFAPAVFDLLLPNEPATYRVGAPDEKPGAVITARS